MPAKGVYACYSSIGGKTYLSAVNIGTRPTVTKSDKIVLEAHIINFHRDILGKIIEIIFLEKIREEKKLGSLDELKEAIGKDVEYVLKNTRNFASP